MKYHKYNLNSYHLHVIKTAKFKTVSVLISFKRPIKKEELTIRSFLHSLMLYSTKKFPTKRLMEIEAEELYGLDLWLDAKHLGNYNIMTFGLNMIDEKYTEKGMYEKGLAFLFEALFNPNVDDGGFEEKSFNIVKNLMISSLKSIKDDTTRYCNIRMLEEMDINSPISYREAYLEDLEKLDRKMLYDYYKSIIKSDEIDVYVLGEVDVNQTKKFFRDNFKVNTIKKSQDNLIIEHNTYRKRIKKVNEKEKIKQAKFSIGCKLIGLTDYERKYVMEVYTFMLGGPSYSKLFRSVREKNSLAYYIICSYQLDESLLLIYSGIDKNNFDKAFSIVKQEISNMIKGNIIDEELDNAKKDIIGVIEAIEDSSYRTINACLKRNLLDLGELKERKEKFNKVTKEDIIKVAKKVKVDTVFLLYGDDKDEKNID
jgi:predicted Zn-dependent peptidase